MNDETRAVVLREVREEMDRENAQYEGCEHREVTRKFNGDVLCKRCSLVVGYWRAAGPDPETFPTVS